MAPSMAPRRRRRATAAAATRWACMAVSVAAALMAPRALGQPSQCTDVPEVTPPCRTSFTAYTDDQTYLNARNAFEAANANCYNQQCQSSGQTTCTGDCDAGMDAFSDACGAMGGQVCEGQWTRIAHQGSDNEATYLLTVYDCFPTTCDDNDVGIYAQCDSVRNCATDMSCQLSYSCGKLGAGAIVAIIVGVLATVGLGVGAWLWMKRRAQLRSSEAGKLLEEHQESTL
uniref:Uncharacterized protein n=1 Tax=Bicosoecida sp. CB-2014 TaxID=1486930 RepID=A0A7S1G4P6_9STRA